VEPFFGRARELEAIAEARRTERLVTLLGPPGIGKTRLVRRYLDDLGGQADVVYFCDLTPARDLAATVARAMGVRRVEDVAGAIADAGPIVLALDNLEAIAKEAGPLIAEWCARAPEAFFIVTSRVRLGVAGEHVIDVPPLDLTTDAVALFVSLARATPPPALMAALEGIPLAIELAAARSRVLGPERVLSRGRAVLSALSAAIDASWEMLTETERWVLAQCSIFATAFSIEAAEAVIEAPDVLDALTSLVDKSLLRSTGDGHFSLFVSIREYAAERLENRASVAARHRNWILASTRPRWEEFARTGASAARKALAAAKDELLAVGDDPLAILYLEPTLAVESGYEELLATLERGIELAEGDVRARLVMARGNARGIRGHLEESLDDFERARAEALDPVIRAEALMFAGVRYRNLGRFDDARAAGDEALRVLTESGADAPRVEGACRAVMGLLLFELGEAAPSRTSNLRARAIFDAAGDRWSEALPLANLAQLDQAAGEYEMSAREYEQALLRFREHGDRRYEARYLGYRAGLEHERGDFAAARAIYATSLELLASMRIAPTEGYFRACLAALEAADGRVDDALRELERAEMLLASGAPPAAVAALEVHRGHLDLMLARGAAALRATTLVARAQQRLRDAQLADRSEDVRFAVRLLTRALAGSVPAPSRAVLHVDADARAFRIGDQPPVDLTRRAALRHIVTALVEARGKPLTADELLALGWPGEKVLGDAGANRVRVAISTLRRLGLASVLLTSDAGYFLDARALA
jgi:predicted ATPase